MNIKYKIVFHTDWHCGSGLAAGADVDALVVKDKNGMPFIPGKTIKGLIRESVEEIRCLQGKCHEDLDIFENAFGYFDKDKEEMRKGSMFFTNATLEENEYDVIISNDAATFLYRKVASTAIGKDGIAKEHSLRKMEVVVPCILIGEIHDVPFELGAEIKEAMKFIKRLGLNRNRGLGRCTISIIEGKEGHNENA